MHKAGEPNCRKGLRCLKEPANRQIYTFTSRATSRLFDIADILTRSEESVARNRFVRFHRSLAMASFPYLTYNTPNYLNVVSLLVAFMARIQALSCPLTHFVWQTAADACSEAYTSVAYTSSLNTFKLLCMCLITAMSDAFLMTDDGRSCIHIFCWQGCLLIRLVSPSIQPTWLPNSFPRLALRPFWEFKEGSGKHLVPLKALGWQAEVAPTPTNGLRA